MNDLFVIAAHNTFVALILALFVYGLSRVWKNPPAIHVLWLLVLLKLVAPPVMRVDWTLFVPRGFTISNSNSTPQPRRDSKPLATADSRAFVVRFEANPTLDRQFELENRPAIKRTPPRTKVIGLTASPLLTKSAARLSAVWSFARPILFGFWIAGSAVCALITTIRIVRFERLLRDTLPAPGRWQRLTQQVADQIGLRRMPQVCFVDCVDTPLVWSAGGRPKLVLPMGLFQQLDDRTATMILAHELAHLRRRDHWVRGVEMFVSILYWWNPLVRIIRRQIHQAEDVCCDAWARWVYPDSAECFAEAVLKTAELLSMPRIDARLPSASLFFHTFSLKERIEMILNGRFAPRISAQSTCIIVLFTMMLWPSFIQSTKTEARAAANDAPATPAAKPDPSKPSEFPHVVKFEQGATRFLQGDKITVLEVRGTAETFSPGNIYWIKGNYKLASHDKANLAAYTTAMEGSTGTDVYLKVQTVEAKKGEGTFTLFLPTSLKGWPHVSFYPVDGGESFGGNYFGTGDTVLKYWWESEDDSLVRELENLGGRVERDELQNGAVISVDFGGSSILRDADIQRLQAFKSLSTVGLGNTEITDAALEHLAELEKTRTLTKLNLRIATKSDVGSKVTKGLKELNTLYIDNTEITENGLLALTSLQNLSTLGLGHTRLSDTGLKTVAQLKGLTHLYIDNTHITDAGLLELKDIKTLTTLGLGHTKLSDAGLKTVGQFTGLTHLYIDNTQITDAGLEELKNLKKLDTLGLGHTAVTDAGLKKLQDLKDLATLYVDNTQVTESGAQELKKALPNINIIR